MDLTNIMVLNDPEQFRRVLYQTACGYMDFWEYHMTLENLSERCDETIEEYDLKTWLQLSDPIDGGDLPLSLKMLDTVNTASDMFEEMTNRTRAACGEQLSFYLTQPAAEQERMLGFSVQVPAEQQNLYRTIFFQVLEDEYLLLSPEELEQAYVDKDIKIVDTIKAHNFKYQRFLACLEAERPRQMLQWTPEQLERHGIYLPTEAP